jgi:hypothetical protein
MVNNFLVNFIYPTYNILLEIAGIVAAASFQTLVPVV